MLQLKKIFLILTQRFYLLLRGLKGMRSITLIMIIMTILETYRLSIIYLRRDIKLPRKLLETCLLISMVILSYFNLNYGLSITCYISIIFSIYVLIKLVMERINKNNYVSILSVKNSLDMASTGIMFLKDKDKLLLINNTMHSILSSLNITKDYINNLVKHSFKESLIKANDKVYQINVISNTEVILYDVTDIYKLHEKEELQNKMIEFNNKKIINTINNMEKIEKTKNLLKIKNEYHDILGHRLALLTSYLEQDKSNVQDIKFIINNAFEEDKNIKPTYKLNNLIKMYNIIGINILFNGKLSYEEDISNVLFEVIREAITNAIIHADSKNISIDLVNYLDRVEMTIINDGSKYKGIIHENEGIKGMRRKLSNIGGSLSIDNKDKFTLKVCIKK